MITKVTVTGDLVEVTAEAEGDVKIVRRHVQDYALLNITQKQQLWHDIAGEPVTEYLPAPVISSVSQAEVKKSLLTRLFSYIWN